MLAQKGPVSYTDCCRRGAITPPPAPPGDHIALICDGRIWATNADGRKLGPLAGSDERFRYLQWSPHSRWLFATWQPDVTGAPVLLYLLAADGSEGHPLADDDQVPAAQVLPLGWSPNSREAVCAIWHKVATFPMDVRAVDVESGETRVLPGVPSWSPDGEHLNYVTESYGSAWLASGGWENAYRIADRAWAVWQGANWSPDGTRLALQLDEAGRVESAIAVYDLQTERLTTLVTSTNLTEAFSSFEGDYVTDGVAPSTLFDRPLLWLWPFGWSADGSQILVWAERSDRVAGGGDLSILGVIPIDGSAPRVLAYIRGSFLGSASWSPTDPDRLAFTRLPRLDHGSHRSRLSAGDRVRLLVAQAQYGL